MRQAPGQAPTRRTQTMQTTNSQLVGSLRLQTQPTDQFRIVALVTADATKKLTGAGGSSSADERCTSVGCVCRRRRRLVRRAGCARARGNGADDGGSLGSHSSPSDDTTTGWPPTHQRTMFGTGRTKPTNLRRLV